MSLITVEGVDGTGKSTLAAGLARAIPDALLLREPGGVETSERIRTIVKDPALRIGDRAEALLYAAARAQLVDERLRPALLAGRTVILDRFTDSSLAYQGGARGLGVEAVRKLNRFATGGLVPDRTLLLSLDGAVAAARARARGEAPDRLEPSSTGPGRPTPSWRPPSRTGSASSTPPRGRPRCWRRLSPSWPT
jgi:dTMP kinase